MTDLDELISQTDLAVEIAQRMLGLDVTDPKVRTLAVELMNRPLKELKTLLYWMSEPTGV